MDITLSMHNVLALSAILLGLCYRKMISPENTLQGLNANSFMSDKLFQYDYQENLDATCRFAAWHHVSTCFWSFSQQRREMPGETACSMLMAYLCLKEFLHYLITISDRRRQERFYWGIFAIMPVEFP